MSWRLLGRNYLRVNSMGIIFPSILAIPLKRLSRLLVASEYDAFQIVGALSPYLAGSASIVVQNQFLQVCAFNSGDNLLTDCPISPASC